MAALTYLIALELATAVVVGALTMDLLIYLRSGPGATISAYLRSHPSRFWIPVGVVVVGIVELYVHLYLVWWL
jgi:hypothetical protein